MSSLSSQRGSGRLRHACLLRMVAACPTLYLTRFAPTTDEVPRTQGLHPIQQRKLAMMFQLRHQRTHTVRTFQPPGEARREEPPREPMGRRAVWTEE